MDRPLQQTPAWRKGAVALALVLACAVVLASRFSNTGAGQAGQTHRLPRERVTVGEVTRGPLEDFIPVRGRLEPRTSVHLETWEGGRVERVLVEDGAMVTAGQPLVTLTNNALQLDIISRQTELAQQRNTLRTAELDAETRRQTLTREQVDLEHQVLTLKRTLERTQALVEKGSAAPVELEQAQDAHGLAVKRLELANQAGAAEEKLRQAQVTQLRASVKQCEANLEFARRNAEALTLRAPMAGQLTALDVAAGQTKERGARLGQVDSTADFKIVAEVDEFYVARVTLGQDALLTWNGQATTATVHKVYPQIRGGHFTVDLLVKDVEPTGMRRGQTVDLRLQLGGAAEAVRIPVGVFFQDTGGNWAFVLGASGDVATKRAVRLGRRNPEFMEVLEGLTPGERIITSSYQTYANMDRLEFDTSATR